MLHDVASAQVRLFGHAAAVPAVQVCDPPQVSAGVSVEPEQLAAAQSALTLHSTQPSVPLQTLFAVEQSVVAPATHAPAALQVSAAVNVVPLQPAPAQSAAELHSTQASSVALQTSPFAAQSVVPATHEPLPLHALVVSWLPLQPGVPQLVAEVGYMHAPVASHALVPQVGSVLLHAAVQQLPPPQAPDTHWSSAVHAPVAFFGTQAPPEQ